jgi:serine/threonine protein kinase
VREAGDKVIFKHQAIRQYGSLHVRHQFRSRAGHSAQLCACGRKSYAHKEEHKLVFSLRWSFRLSAAMWSRDQAVSGSRSVYTSAPLPGRSQVNAVTSRSPVILDLDSTPPPPPVSTPPQSLNPRNKSQFDVIRNQLAVEIRLKFISPSTEPGELDPNSFLPRGEAREVFTGQKSNVELLFVLGNPSIDQDLGNSFYKAVLASDVKPEDREDRALCNILALLIHVGTEADSEEWQGFETLVRSRVTSQSSKTAGTMLSSSTVCDGNLPMRFEDIQTYFGTARAHPLNEAQFKFCPVILRKDESLTLRDWHVLPFLEPEKKIGQGSHGAVYKVKVAQGHFRDKKGNANGRPIWFARKDFTKLAEDNRGYEAEWLIIQQFVRNLTNSRSVMMTRASLQRGTTFSVFFDLALGDLSNYMKEEGNRSDDWKWKRHILCQTFLLAQGLNYLHNQLIDESSHRLISCFHTDLKPSNILVVKAPSISDGDEPLFDISFKITDFSVSRISYRNHKNVTGADVEGIDVKEADVGRPFHQESARDKSVTSSVGASMQCLAPEALAKNARVKASADIWAFGCVLSIVVAWVYGGQKAIERFSTERAHATGAAFTTSADWFFTPFGSGKVFPKEHEFVATIEEATGEEKERVLTVNPAVQPWFMRIVNGSQGMEQLMYRKIWDLLGSSILIAKPERRDPIEAVWDSLEGILSVTMEDARHTHPLVSPLNTRKPSTTQSSSTAHSPRPSHLSEKPELLTLQPYKGSEAGYKSNIVKVELKNKKGASRCIASPNGMHFVFFDIQNISLTSLKDSLLDPSSKSHTDDAKSLHPPDKQSWATVGLSANYLCAATNDPRQTTFVFCDLTAQHNALVKPLNKAICDHGNCTAIAVCQERNTSAIVVVYAAETRDEGSKSRAVFWFEQTTAPREGHSRPTPTRLELKNGLTGEVKDLRVSADGQYVSIVEQTTSDTVQAKIIVRVHTWDLWRKNKQRTLETSPGRDRPGLARAVFTSIAHVADQPAFVLIMQESVVKIFNFRTAEMTTLVDTTDKNTSRYLQCIPEKGGRSLLLEIPLGTKVVSVHKYIASSSGTPVSGFPIMAARKTPIFRPNDCAAICYTPNHEQGILVLAHCDGKIGKIEIMHCPAK